MNSNLKVLTIVIFGVALSMFLPNIYKDNGTKMESAEPTVTYSNDVAVASPVDTATLVTTPQNNEVTTEDNNTEDNTVVTEEKIEEVQTPAQNVESTPAEVVTPTVSEPTVSDDVTLAELSAKLDKSLKSNLSGTGIYFAKYASEMEIDPYLAVAIVLHETGCSWTCSKLVRECNNVGGMKGSPGCGGGSYKAFDTLEDGIYGFMNNLKVNYYDKGLTTPETIGRKYAGSDTWSSKVNYYIDKIKNA